MPRFSITKRFVAPLRFAFVALGALLAAACIPPLSDDNGEGEIVAPPVIAYGEPVLDSTGDHATLSVISTGGAVARFVALPEFPGHATLDTLTGRIEYEIPGGTLFWETYQVVAIGLGGMDTAEVEIPVMDTIITWPGPEPQVSVLVLNIGLSSTTTGGLAKASALSLSKLVITMTSSNTADSILRDTVFASEAVGAALSPVASQDQSILKSYLLKPLRSWTVDVKTLDINGIVIHQGSGGVNNLLVGETRAVALNLANRYQPHAAKFSFPDSVAMTTGAAKQKLSVSRIVMMIDGDTVRDTTGTFASSPTAHHLAWDYVPADSAHVVGLFVYADGFGSWPAAQPAFGDTFLVPATSATTVQQLPWLGGAGTGPTLTVQYGPASQIVVNPPIDPNPLPRRAAGR